MAKITRTNPEGISKPFSNYSHVVTAEARRSSCSNDVVSPDSVACQLVSVFGPKLHALAHGHTAPFCPVPSNWVAKW